MPQPDTSHEWQVDLAVGDIAPVAAEPPIRLAYSHDLFDGQTVARLVEQWNETGDTAAAYNLAVTHAVYRRDWEGARRLAKRFEGHRYLLVPIHQTFAEAEGLCRELGAHQLSVSSWEEYRFTRELQRSHALSNVWLALPAVARPERWLTGEPMICSWLRLYMSPDSRVRWYQLESNARGWFFHDAEAERRTGAGVIAEWDE